jgi:hypothetical protein
VFDVVQEIAEQQDCVFPKFEKLSQKVCKSGWWPHQRDVH